MNSVFMLGIIANRGIREKFIQFFKFHNIHVTLTVLGEGTANSAILDYLGMEATQKTLYFAFVTWDTWKLLKKDLYAQVKIDVPGRGIAFLIPLSSIGGKTRLKYLTVGQELSIEEESTLQNTDYELLPSQIQDILRPSWTRQEAQTRQAAQ